MNKKLLIGWSEKDITPDVLGKRIPLYGLYYARIAQGIHARLKCVSAAFAKSSEHFVNCTLDNAGYLRQLLDRVRQNKRKTFRLLMNMLILQSPSSQIALTAPDLMTANASGSPAAVIFTPAICPVRMQKSSAVPTADINLPTASWKRSTNFLIE